MKKLTSLLVLSGVLAAPAFAADSPHTVTGNMGATTDYVFRGVSQTQNGPAIQGGVDYTHASGIYLGAWGSNVSWVSEGVAGGYKDNNSMELDFYGGYRGAIADTVNYDVGIVKYYYPGDSMPGQTTPDTIEVYAGVTYKYFTLKYSHAVSDYFIAWGGPGAKSGGSYYLDLSGTYDLGNGWGVLGHIGYQKVKNTDDASYTDWKIGVTKDIGFGVLTLAYTDTDADEGMYTWNDEKVADGRLALSFFKSF